MAAVYNASIETVNAPGGLTRDRAGDRPEDREISGVLSREENELLTGVGVGTPMGDLMRQYWIPVVCASEVEAGGRVKRVKILGEDLIVYRAPNGTHSTGVCGAAT